MIAGPPELPGRCDTCGYEIPFGQIPRNDYRALLYSYYFQEHTEELRMLEMVDDFRSRRGREAANTVPHFQRVLDSDDPQVQRQLAEGVPFDQIQLPLQPEQQSTGDDDQQVINYLKYSSFDLVARFEFVRERLRELRKTVCAVPCPRCPGGSLRLVD